MGQCGLLGYDLTHNFMTGGRRIAKYLSALNQTLTSDSPEAAVPSSSSKKTTIFNLICRDWMNMKSNIYRFFVSLNRMF